MEFVTFWTSWLRAKCSTRSQTGSAIVEYALLLTLLIMVCLLAIAFFGDEMSRKYESLAAGIR